MAGEFSSDAARALPPGRESAAAPDGVRFGRFVPVALLLVALAAVLAVVGQQDAHRGRAAGLLAAGVVTGLTGLVVAARWWRAAPGAGRRSAEYLLFSGVAIGLAGLGQIQLGVDALDGSLTGFGVGDGLRTLAAVIGLPVFLAYPRSSGSPHPTVRLALDGLVAGISIAFCIWCFTLGGLSGDLTGRDLIDLLYLVSQSVIVAVIWIAAVRDVRSRLWLLAVGVTFIEVAEANAVFRVSVDGAERFADWPYGVLWVLGIPLIGLGLLHYRRRPVDIDGVQDRRDFLASTGATAVAALALGAGMLFGHSGLEGLDTYPRSALIMLLMLVPAAALRDVLSGWVRRRMSIALREDEFRDTLTGLANRRALLERIQVLPPGSAYAVLTLDLDGFKQVNDVLGPMAGDRLLIQVADVLRMYQPVDGLVARTGGDEFVVLTPGDLADGERLAMSLRAQVKVTLSQAAPGLGTALSVGVGRLTRRGAPAGPDGTPELSALVESAAALRAAKSRERGAIEVFDGDVARDHDRRLAVERRLRRAIAHRHLRTHAQPLVDLATGRLTGFEALARWDDEELGPVSPFEFIPVAEHTGLVRELGEHLLQNALESAKSAGVFEAGLTVSINASPIELRVPGYADVLRHHLTRCRIAPDRVVIEVTEAILGAEDDPALRTLADLAMIGVGIAIDDFGTGYSALGYLRRLPTAVLKIDKSLTWSLTEERTAAIVDGVIRIAHRMGVRVVMEGIEDDDQAARCTELGADVGQGWLFGRPEPWSAAAELVLQRSRAEHPVPVPAPRRAGTRSAAAQASQGDDGPTVPADADRNPGAGRGSGVGAQRPPSSA